MPWYTWVFSGIGTAILLSTLTALYRNFRANGSIRPASPHTSLKYTPARRQSSEPNPIQIGREVKAHLPIDRDHAREKYKGLNVAWEGKFCSLSPEFETSFENGIATRRQIWRIYCRFGNDGLDPDAGIFFNLNLLQPELKVLREGSTVWVEGKIKYVSEVGGFGSVKLEDDPAVTVIKPLNIS